MPPIFRAAAVDEGVNYGKDFRGFNNFSLPQRHWVSLSLLVAALFGATYQWVDRPVALLAHRLVASGGPLQPLFRVLTHLPDLLTGICVLMILLIPISILSGALLFRRVGTHPIVLMSGSLVLASAAKTLLKFCCGRTWPETWIRNNPSWARDGLFGFFPFHGGAGWSSFPSGHMAAIVSVAAVASHLWPRLDALWGLICIGAAAGLIILDLHFVSDVIGGAYVGFASASAVLWLYSRWLPGGLK